MAEAYYGEGDFEEQRPFEQLKPIYRGKPQSERITYFMQTACLIQNPTYQQLRI